MGESLRVPTRPQSPTEEQIRTLAAEGYEDAPATMWDVDKRLAAQRELTESYDQAMSEWRDDALDFAVRGIARLLGEDAVAGDSAPDTEAEPVDGKGQEAMPPSDAPSPEDASVPRLSEGGDVSLSPPGIGFTTLHVGQCVVRGVSYLTDAIVEDMCEWFVAVLDGRDFTIELDCESYGYAFLVSTARGDVLVCRDGKPPIAYIDFFDDAPAAARRFAASIRKHLAEWVDWTLPDDEDRPVIEVGILGALTMLEAAAGRAEIAAEVERRIREIREGGDDE